MNRWVRCTFGRDHAVRFVNLDYYWAMERRPGSDRTKLVPTPATGAEQLDVVETPEQLLAQLSKDSLGHTAKTMKSLRTWER